MDNTKPSRRYLLKIPSSQILKQISKKSDRHLRLRHNVVHKSNDSTLTHFSAQRQTKQNEDLASKLSITRYNHGEMSPTARKNQPRSKKKSPKVSPKEYRQMPVVSFQYGRNAAASYKLSPKSIPEGQKVKKFEFNMTNSSMENDIKEFINMQEQLNQEILEQQMIIQEPIINPDLNFTMKRAEIIDTHASLTHSSGNKQTSENFLPKSIIKTGNASPGLKDNDSPTRSRQNLSSMSLNDNKKPSNQQTRIKHNSSNVSVLKEIMDSVPDLHKTHSKMTGMSNQPSLKTILVNSNPHLPIGSGDSKTVINSPSVIKSKPMFKDSGFNLDQDMIRKIQIVSKLQLQHKLKTVRPREPLQTSQFDFFSKKKK